MQRYNLLPGANASERIPIFGDQVLNFGLGNHSKVDSLIIVWPDDRVQKLSNIPTKQTITLNITDATGKWNYTSSAANTPPYFKTDTIQQIKHTENIFNDFTVQRLLPGYYSRQGPAIAVADINKDGRDDIFMGNAKGSASGIFLQNEQNLFQPFNSPISKADNGEVTAAEFFDANGDGYADLYIAHGGYEFEENDAAFQDKLYMNDSKGNFTERQLPPLLFSKGCVKAADIDGDGDIDLFIGGRVIPGKYPLSPPSKTLLNDGKGNFTDATSSIAAMFDTLGMVTDAVWTDINHDKKPDLIVVGEWMPVKFFINENNKLKDESDKYIHFPSTGLWNRITVADIDHDGDQDFILGNVGSNTQFHVSDKEPLTLTYSDFDKNGSLYPVLCYYINGKSYPAFSRDDLAEQLPFINKKFLDYKSYSTATLNEIFTKEQLDNSKTLKAELMETVWLENKGSELALHHLPTEAQYSPVYGITVVDINGDKNDDILLTGNNVWTRIKFGRYTANHGILLAGDGHGNFEYVPQTKSGLKIREDVRNSTLLKGNKIILGVNDGKALLLSY
ncbi:MAG: FG-GAP-like repeat-containing protein [Chitinophagaceae bacterium]